MISLSLIVDDDIAQSIGDHLIELDALSLSFSDSDLDTKNEVAIFGEDPDDHERYWKNTKVMALFQSDHTLTEVINSIHNEFNIHIDQIQVEPVAEKDWVKETQSQFKPIQINDKIWIPYFPDSQIRTTIDRSFVTSCSETVIEPVNMLRPFCQITKHIIKIKAIGLSISSFRGCIKFRGKTICRHPIFLVHGYFVVFRSYTT